MSVSIAAQDLGVTYMFDRQRRPVTPMLARIRRSCTLSWSLRHVDLAIGPGESVALVGGNGAGKTTLLRTMAGVFRPDAGQISVHGRVGSLLSIDAGLLSRLTGRENSVLLGVLAGLTRAQAREALPHIERRCRLGPAFERPVSTYSQGMRARLGFSVIEQARPQVLLLDEVHEALDDEFRQVVLGGARAVLNGGGIVVAAGHDHSVLRRLCTRAIRLENGAVVADGTVAELLTDHQPSVRLVSHAGASL